MRRWSTAAVLLVCLVASCAARPARGPGTPGSPDLDPAATLVEISSTLDRATAAYNAGDYDAFVAVYSSDPEASMIVDAPALEPTEYGTVHLVRGGEAIRALYAAAPLFQEGFARPTLSYAGVQVHLLATDLAWVAAVCVISGGDARVPRRALTTLVMRRVNGRWLVLHDHTR